MFTRCPKCKEVHPLTASVLSRSTGLVQCGRCNRIFNALSFLSDDWHASQTFKPEDSSGGELPVLGGRSKRNVRKVANTPAVEASAKQATTAANQSSADQNGLSQGASSEAEANLTNGDPTGHNQDGSENQIAGQTDSTSESLATDAAMLDQVAEQADEDSDGDQQAADSKPGLMSNKLWLMGTLVLLLITVINVGWTFRDRLLANPTVHQWLQDHNWVEADKPKGMLKSPADIQLVSRDMHTHPTRTGILVLSVTFVNLAQQTQAFPVLRITLLDAGNQPIAQRRLQPIEYLRAGANVEAGLAPDVFLPILLELADPGEQAVGFEIEFL